MESSSLPYWNDRWAKAPMDFASSWPDRYARGLETTYLYTALPRAGTVLEIGCGNFQLAEEPRLLSFLCGRYVGVDGSPPALEAARRRAGPGFEFLERDLTTCDLPLADFILSKRTLQNIHPDARGLLLKKVLSYPHGVLIEDCSWARWETDRLRAALDRKSLAIPEYNYPLVFQEVVGSRSLTSDPFMGYFYAITRVFPDLPKEGFEAGFCLSHRAILAGERQPFFGPVIALRW